MGSAAVQGELWGAAAQDWALFQEPVAKPLWKAQQDAVAVKLGTRFLDAGCGSGGACVLAAERGAMVSGLDASENLIFIARSRVPDGTFAIGDLEELPFEDASFDAITATNSVQYASDPVAALRELKRVLAPGGRLSVASWGAPERCEYGAVLKAVSGSLLNPPTGPGPFGLAAPGKLEGLLEQAGLRPISSGEVNCTYHYPDLDTGWLASRSAGVVINVIRQVGEEKVKGAVIEAMKPYRNAHGVRMENIFRFVVATA